MVMVLRVGYWCKTWEINYRLAQPGGLILNKYEESEHDTVFKGLIDLEMTNFEVLERTVL